MLFVCFHCNSVDVQVTRVGGAFGGKSQYPPLIAAAAAIAANSLDRYFSLISLTTVTITPLAFIKSLYILESCLSKGPFQRVLSFLGNIIKKNEAVNIHL